MGTPRLVARGDVRPRQRPQGQGEDHVLPRSQAPRPREALQRGPEGNKWRAIDFREGDKIDKARSRRCCARRWPTTPRTGAEEQGLESLTWPADRRRRPQRRRSRRSSRAATPRSRRATAMRPCRPTSRPCRAGSATPGAASTRSSCAPCPACARPSEWNSPFYGVEGQGWFLGLPLLHEVRQGDVSSAARRCVRSRPARPRTRTRATSTSTRTTRSTRSSWRAGSGRHRSCRASGCSEPTSEGLVTHPPAPSSFPPCAKCHRPSAAVSYWVWCWSSRPSARAPHPSEPPSPTRARCATAPGPPRGASTSSSRSSTRRAGAARPSPPSSSRTWRSRTGSSRSRWTSGPARSGATRAGWRSASGRERAREPSPRCRDGRS